MDHSFHVIPAERADAVSLLRSALERAIAGETTGVVIVEQREGDLWNFEFSSNLEKFQAVGALEHVKHYLVTAL